MFKDKKELFKELDNVVSSGIDNERIRKDDELNIKYVYFSGHKYYSINELHTPALKTLREQWEGKLYAHDGLQVEAFKQYGTSDQSIYDNDTYIYAGLVEKHFLIRYGKDHVKVVEKEKKTEEQKAKLITKEEFEILVKDKAKKGWWKSLTKEQKNDHNAYLKHQKKLDAETKKGVK